MNFIPLKSVLKKVLAEKNMAAKFNAAQICSVAEKLFLAELPDLSGKFVARFVKNKMLHIAVLSSSLAAEMRLAETTVLDALNKRGAKLKAVRYEVGKLPEKVLPY